MKVVIQRVLNSSVVIDDGIKKCISKGLMILVGMTYNDNEDDIDYLINKIINLRIFEENEKMNLSVKDIDAQILLIPQFTLYADCKSGNRPSFKDALGFNEASKLFYSFIEKLSKTNIKFETGEFGSDMKVSLINDGPVTIIIDSKMR